MASTSVSGASSSPSRRSLTVAGAWTVPALVVLGAAPAHAASPPKVGPVTAVKENQNKDVRLTIPITGAASVSTITVTAISGGGQGASTWQLPVTASIPPSGSTSALVFRNNNASGTYTATYVINPGGYTGTFGFSV